MEMLKKLKRLITNSEGVVAIIVALLIVAFIGMTALVVDMGSLYEDRTSLQSVADAAALAGAQELPQSRAKAKQAATDYITNNRIDINSIDIQVISTNGYPDDTIIVMVDNSDSPIRFNSIGSHSVKAVAKAIVGTPLGLGETVPWCVIEGTYNSGEDYPLNNDKFGEVAFTGQHTGGSTYRTNIEVGHSVVIDEIVTVDFLNGFKSGPTEQGSLTRFGPPPLDKYFISSVSEDDLANQYSVGGNTFYELAKYDTQFVMCPIVSQETADTGEGPVIGFAPFIVTFYDKKTVLGRFLDRALLVNTGELGTVDEMGIKVVRLVPLTRDEAEYPIQ